MRWGTSEVKEGWYDDNDDDRYAGGRDGGRDGGWEGGRDSLDKTVDTFEMTDPISLRSSLQVMCVCVWPFVFLNFTHA